MSVIELLKSIEKRPSMFLGAKSISCLKSFINGWHFRQPDEETQMYILNDFSKWLQKNYDLNDTRGWEKIILFYSEDEPDALKNFFLFFNDFLRESA